MFEKRLRAISSRTFLTNGGSDGTITIADTRPFKVKQEVVISANTLTNLELEVKKVLDSTTMVIGPRSPNINAVTDLSAYTTALSAIIFANEQKRPSIPFEEYERANYEEEPTVADRVIMVDEWGDKYNESNPFPVDATVNLTASKPKFHTVFNKLVTSPNVEQNIILPANTEIITIMVRSNKGVKLQYTFTAGESGSKFITVNPGVRKEIAGIGLPLATPLYFQLSLTEVGGTIVEIETWNT